MSQPTLQKVAGFLCYESIIIRHSETPKTQRARLTGVDGSRDHVSDVWYQCIQEQVY